MLKQRGRWSEFLNIIQNLHFNFPPALIQTKAKRCPQTSFPHLSVAYQCSAMTCWQIQAARACVWVWAFDLLGVLPAAMPHGHWKVASAVTGRKTTAQKKVSKLSQLLLASCLDWLEGKWSSHLCASWQHCSACLMLWKPENGIVKLNWDGQWGSSSSQWKLVKPSSDFLWLEDLLVIDYEIGHPVLAVFFFCFNHFFIVIFLLIVLNLVLVLLPLLSCPRLLIAIQKNVLCQRLEAEPVATTSTVMTSVFSTFTTRSAWFSKALNWSEPSAWPPKVQNSAKSRPVDSVDHWSSFKKRFNAALPCSTRCQSKVSQGTWVGFMSCGTIRLNNLEPAGYQWYQWNVDLTISSQETVSRNPPKKSSARIAQGQH